MNRSIVSQKSRHIDQYMSVNLRYLSESCNNETTRKSREANEENTDVGALLFRVSLVVVPFMLYCVD